MTSSNGGGSSSGGRGQGGASSQSRGQKQGQRSRQGQPQGQKQGQKQGQGQNKQGRSGPKPGPKFDKDDKVGALTGPLGKVLARLPDIERSVLELRMGMTDGHPKNLSATANALGLTMHEAKQIEQRAFERIREVVPLGQLQKFLGG